MPILNHKPTVKFDPNNPKHVKAIAEIELTGKRSSNIKFDYQAPFVDGVSYAKHVMHLAWIESMAQIHVELFEDLKPAIERGKKSREAPDERKPVIIGSKAPLERPAAT